MPWEEVRKVCLDYTIYGLEELSKAPRNDRSKPLRFVYVSGANAERDPTKKPWLLGEYIIMRVRYLSSFGLPTRSDPFFPTSG